MAQPNLPQPSPKATAANPPQEKKLLERYRDAINLKHYSARTGDTYIKWTKDFIIFHNKRHPQEMGAPETPS